MRRVFRPFLWALLLGLWGWTPGLAGSGDPGAMTPAKKAGPIEVQSRTLELDDAKQVVTFQGAVHAVQDEFIIDCDKLRVFYTGRPDAENAEGAGAEIDRIVATGNVRIQRAKGGTASAEKAVYYQGEEKLVLTGNPVVRQGRDRVEGERITLYLAENRSVVESTGDEKVKAVIFPRRKTR